MLSAFKSLTLNVHEIALQVRTKFTMYGRMVYVHMDDVASCRILLYETPRAAGRYICNSAVLNINELLVTLLFFFFCDSLVVFVLLKMAFRHCSDCIFLCSLLCVYGVTGV
ncbi:Os08g0516100 [Oryza sativa Japonica Group]|uniref:Uncharacterized protein n=2 Tax=Oryza sativa subsp. japonica TaxID=39947 RepID=A0A0P0XIF0_ORYSJ|nr:hypothetical protein [Oryza sativa Japonica Group]BAT06236.1 Os08g0516100 [Oryza sativa Japonica Group]